MLFDVQLSFHFYRVNSYTHYTFVKYWFYFASHVSPFYGFTLIKEKEKTYLFHRGKFLDDYENIKMTRYES